MIRTQRMQRIQRTHRIRRTNLKRIYSSRTRRLFTVLLLCLGIAGLLAGCGAGAAGEPDSPASEGNGNETVSEQLQETQSIDTGEEDFSGETEESEGFNGAEGGESADDVQSTVRNCPEVELVRCSRFESRDSEQGLVSLLSAQYDMVRLSEDSADRWPRLADALADAQFNFRRGMESELDEYARLAGEQYENYPEMFAAPYEDNSTVTVRRTDSRALSLLRSVSVYTGGAHPYYYFVSDNYDSVTGRQLSLGDVCQNMDGLKDILEERLLEQYGEDIFFDLHETLSSYGTESFTWTLEPESLTVWFSPYELAYYAAGAQVVRLPLEKYPELFGGWTDMEEDVPWAMYPNLWEEAVYAADADGEVRTVSLEGEYNSLNECYTSFSVQCGGTSLTEQLTAYELTPVLMYDGDGHCYLLADASGDNDLHSLYVYELTDSGAEKCAEMDNAGFACWRSVEEQGYIRRPPVETEAFTLTRRCRLLGSCDMRGLFCLDMAGQIQTVRDWYDIPGEIVLTARKELTLPVAETSGGEETGESGTVPQGAELSMIRTDGESWVDVSYGGRLYRINVRIGEDGEQYIDGEAAESLFSGILFAG